MELDAMRRSYIRASLDESAVPDDPFSLLKQWLGEANASSPGDWFEANTMVLSTADLAGNVSSRVVLLKGSLEEELCFYTNYDSLKGRQLATNDRCSLTFFWPHLERQIRATGRAERVPPAMSDKYFHSRPRDSQIGAVVSAQSERVPNRQQLEDAFAEAHRKFADVDPIPRPENWGGYAVRPVQLEFWQGRPSRLHDRIVYERDGERWQRYRLAP